MKIASSLVVALLSISISVLADESQTNSLMMMAGRGDTDAVRKILDDGTDVNVTGLGGYTALDYAVTKSRLSTVQLLLARGANANSRPPGWGSTPLMVASAQGDLDIVLELLAHKADVNLHSLSQGDTALMAAAAFAHLDIVKELLAHGAKINDHNNDGLTALILATKAGKRDIIDYLKEHGAGSRGR